MRPKGGSTNSPEGVADIVHAGIAQEVAGMAQEEVGTGMVGLELLVQEEVGTAVGTEKVGLELLV